MLGLAARGTDIASYREDSSVCAAKFPARQLAPLAHFRNYGSLLRTLGTAEFEEIVLLGTESFTSAWQDELKPKSAADIAGWLDIVEATGKMPEGMAYSDQFLFIGRRADRVA